MDPKTLQSLGMDQQLLQSLGMDPRTLQHFGITTATDPKLLQAMGMDPKTIYIILGLDPTSAQAQATATKSGTCGRVSRQLFLHVFERKLKLQTMYYSHHLNRYLLFFRQ